MEPERRAPRAPAGEGEIEELCFLVGPTAAGKSELGVELAELAQPSAEIVSLDSMLVYRGMDVGTAKPSRELRERARHHLIDVVEPHDVFSVQHYLAAAQTALGEIRSRGRGALVVGGTALYLKALTHGLFEGPPVDAALRARIERRVQTEGGEALHGELARADPISASRIHARDTKRLVRALEVWEQTGRALSSWQQEWGSRDGPSTVVGRARRIVGLALSPETLERRIAARTSRMLDSGWVEEARAIRDGLGFSATSIQALGYAEVLRLADGELDRAECERAIVLRTRQFARRQRTWFRSFPEISWLEAADTKNLAAQAGEVLGWRRERG